MSARGASLGTKDNPWADHGAVWTSKIHAVVDTHGLPIRLALTAGEAHDNRLAGKLLSRLKSGTMLLADGGYDADWIRALATERGRLGQYPAEMQSHDPVCFSPVSLPARNLVERLFNKIKQCRRVATRYQLPCLHPTCVHQARLRAYASAP
jgi:transposase